MDVLTISWGWIGGNAGGESVVTGTPFVVAIDFFVQGATAVQPFNAGSVETEAFIPGADAAQGA